MVSSFRFQVSSFRFNLRSRLLNDKLDERLGIRDNEVDSIIR